MTVENQQLVYQASLVDVEKGRTNRSFKTATLRLMAVDVVANRTRYNKESILKALPTLRNIPLVGRWKGEDFGSHEVKLELDEEEGFKNTYKTTPLGVIPESANFWFESDDVNGTSQEFLCVDVLLWKRQKEVKSLIRRKQFNISMEVTITEAVKDTSGILDIRDFYFTAVCVLGANVPPAFSGAMIQTYADETQQQVSEMMLEFQAEHPERKEGESMPEMNETPVLETETTEVEAVVEPVVEETPQTTETSETVEVEMVHEEKQEENETSDDDQKEEESEDQESSQSEESVEADKEEEKEEEVEEDEKKDSDAESAYQALKTEYQVMVDTLMTKTQEMSDLQASYEALQQEVVALRTFKEEVIVERRQVVETQLFERFEALSGTTEFEALKTNAKDYSIEDLETQLYALMGRKLYAEQKPASKSAHVAYEATYQAAKSKDSVFNLLDIYLNK